MRHFYHVSPPASTPQRSSPRQPHLLLSPWSHGDFRKPENEKSYTIKFGVTGCFYRLSPGVVTDAVSLEKAVSYQVLQSFTRRFPRSEMLQQSGMRLRSFCPENRMTCDGRVDRFILPCG